MNLRSRFFRVELASALLAIRDDDVWKLLQAEAKAQGLIPAEESFDSSLTALGAETIDQTLIDALGDDDQPTRGAPTLIVDALRRDTPPGTLEAVSL